MSEPGAVLAQRYTLLRMSARTPRGELWQARDGTLDRRVHVLILDPAAAADRAARRAFVDEAARRAAITDPYLAAVYDIGTDPPFVVFEDPGGGRLADRLRSGPLDATLAARIAANVARGVQALERSGDPVPTISSGAVLLSSDGRGKLLPFGTSTTTGDPRRELAALTVLMLTGDDPVDGKVPRREIPSPLADVLSGMLSRDPGRSPSLDTFVDACAALTRPQPVKQERSARGPRGDVGWLVGVVAIVALAIGAVFYGPTLLEGLDREPEGAPSTRPTMTPLGTPLPINEVSDFDPDGDGSEQPDLVNLAVDDDPVTEWRTVEYAQPTMGKPGVGLLFDLGTAQAVRAVSIRTALPGWEGEIRVGNELPEAAADLELATTFTAGNNSRVSLPRGVNGRYVLLWLTQLSADSETSEFPYRARIAEVELFG